MRRRCTTTPRRTSMRYRAPLAFGTKKNRRSSDHRKADLGILAPRLVVFDTCGRCRPEPRRRQPAKSVCPRDPAGTAGSLFVRKFRLFGGLHELHNCIVVLSSSVADVTPHNEDGCSTSSLIILAVSTSISKPGGMCNLDSMPNHVLYIVQLLRFADDLYLKTLCDVISIVEFAVISRISASASAMLQGLHFQQSNARCDNCASSRVSRMLSYGTAHCFEDMLA